MRSRDARTTRSGADTSNLRVARLVRRARRKTRAGIILAIAILIFGVVAASASFLVPEPAPG